MAAPTVKLVNGSNFPVVGLGTWEATDEKQLEDALDAALEIGYRHIDTAHDYGNEKVIGRVLNKWFASGKLKREDIFLTTKLPLEAIHQDRVEPYIKKQLGWLNFDYVDLYLLHFPVCTAGPNAPDPMATIPVDHIAVWKKMEKQVDLGRAKTIGLSNFNIKQIDRILKNARIKPASLQIENHIFLPQNDLVKFAQDNGIVVVAYSPLANPAINVFYDKVGVGAREFPSILTNPTVKKIADKHKKSVAQIALKFLLQRNIVIIPKSVSVNRLKENIDLFKFTLDADDMATLRGLEIGEEARVCDWCVGGKKWADHPEFPWHPKFLK